LPSRIFDSLLALRAKSAISSGHLVQHVQILIRNIDRKLTQPEIVCLFRKHGKVTSCTIVKDASTGLSKGFGFAEMPKTDEALNAIEALNGMKLGDSVLRVKRAAASTVAKKAPRADQPDRSEPSAGFSRTEEKKRPPRKSRTPRN
jgi:RNA recognition motif-containing protein